MFGSDVLEVAIGLSLLFLFVSLLCTALREMIETVMKSRAGDLEKGIAELLFDRQGTNVFSDPNGDLAAFYNHSLINSLYYKQYTEKSDNHGFLARVRRRSNMPTYISSRNFANALIDLTRRAAPSGTSPAVDPVGSLRDSVTKMTPGHLQSVLLTAIDDAQGDFTRVRHNIEAWYNATMDQVSGWYKRRTQAILALLGVMVAVMFNIDAVQVAQTLNTDKSYREAVVNQAGLLVRQSPPQADQAIDEATARARLAQLQKDLDQAGFLIGWPAPQLAACGGAGCAWPGIRMLLGWLATALAVTLGAPFWFDVLNKFMVVRSTVKPSEKSAPEASKDSQPASVPNGAGRTA